MYESSTYGPYSTSENNQNTSDDSLNYSRTINFNRMDYQELRISRLLVITSLPIIIAVGTTGNVLTFIVMQRGSLKHSSTCFYMAMLALADTCKCVDSLLAFIALSAAQSSAQTHIHNAILVIDTPNNIWYNRVHWLIGTPYLSIKVSNVYWNFMKISHYLIKFSIW